MTRAGADHRPPNADGRRVPPRGGRRFAAGRWAAPAALLAAVLLFFYRLAFTGLILARGDTFAYFYPYWQAAREALRAGRLPVWNPDLFMGAPLLANSQMGFYYPLNWPLWWALEPPYAVSAAILLHIFIAAAGAYLAARRALGLSRLAATLAAFLFALGGYLSAQVEHVNQLQGLSWLPWFLVVLSLRHPWPRRAALTGLLFALQLLAGHTQSAFITGVGVGLWVLARPEATADRRPRTAARRLAAAAGRSQSAVAALAPLGVGAALALVLAAAQLWPTLELTGLSSRQGGLGFTEVISFSLHPLLLGRALLPGYGQSLFSEYVALLPLSGLLLAWAGAWGWRRNRVIRPVLLLAGAGLFLALGGFNPLYWLLGRLPGFDLFRAPARWLVLYGLGMALLAGAGLDAVRAGAVPRRAWLTGGALLLGAIAWSWIGVLLSRWIPVGPEAPPEAPGTWTVVGWFVEAALLVILLWRRPRHVTAPTLVAVALTALFLATRMLPYHNLTAPAAYFDLRPPVARLLAADDCALLPDTCSVPRGRVLSLSDIFFDLGDQGELDTIYGDALSPEAQRDLTVAFKRQEVLDPNLPLAYGLASVDGFDGGILPLRAYTELSTVLVPEGTTDGRLRENLASIPDPRWLHLFNAEYVVTDKVGDRWREADGRSVFFDTKTAVTLAPGEVIQASYSGDYEPTALWLLAGGAESTAADIRVYVGWTVRDGAELSVTPVDATLWRAALPETRSIRIVTIQNQGATPLTVEGLALVDERDDTFLALPLGPFSLIHSGDVKIYAVGRVVGRAYLVSRWTEMPDTTAAVEWLEDNLEYPPEGGVVVGQAPFDPADENAGILIGEATIFNYEADYVRIGVNAARRGLVVLSDAYYPGWEATVDGVPAEIYRANGLFRGVFVPEGRHEVAFHYRPLSVRGGLLVSALGVLLWSVIMVGTGLWRRRAA